MYYNSNLWLIEDAEVQTTHTLIPKKQKNLVQRMNHLRGSPQNDQQMPILSYQSKINLCLINDDNQ